jgi:hypothetical protein
MVSAAQAGPKPVPYKLLNLENLTNGIQFCLTREAAVAASGIAHKMQEEDGVRTAVASFHRNLPLERLSCDLLPGFPAVWFYTNGKIRVRLSKVAAEILVDYCKVESTALKL